MFDDEDDVVDMNRGSLPVSNNNNIFVVQEEGQQEEALAQHEQDTYMSDVAGAGAGDDAFLTTMHPTPTPPTPTLPTFQLMNRLPALLSLSCDTIRLSKYQCLVSTVSVGRLLDFDIRPTSCHAMLPFVLLCVCLLCNNSCTPLHL